MEEPRNLEQTQAQETQRQIETLLKTDQDWEMARWRAKLMKIAWNWLKTDKPEPEHTKQMLRAVGYELGNNLDEADAAFGDGFYAYVVSMDRLYSGEEMEDRHWILLGCAWSGQLDFGLAHYDHRYWSKIVECADSPAAMKCNFDLGNFLDQVVRYQKHRASHRVATGRFD